MRTHCWFHFHISLLRLCHKVCALQWNIHLRITANRNIHNQYNKLGIIEGPYKLRGSIRNVDWATFNSLSNLTGEQAQSNVHLSHIAIVFLSGEATRTCNEIFKVNWLTLIMLHVNVNYKNKKPHSLFTIAHWMLIKYFFNFSIYLNEFRFAWLFTEILMRIPFAVDTSSLIEGRRQRKRARIHFILIVPWNIAY